MSCQGGGREGGRILFHRLCVDPERRKKEKKENAYYGFVVAVRQSLREKWVTV